MAWIEIRVGLLEIRLARLLLVYTGRLSPWLTAPHGYGADLAGRNLEKMAMAITFSWRYIFMRIVVTSTVLFESRRTYIARKTRWYYN